MSKAKPDAQPRVKNAQGRENDAQPRVKNAQVRAKNAQPRVDKVINTPRARGV